jgi:hypothetical protein
VAIGARKNDGTGTDAGHVRVLQWSGSAWVQLGEDVDGEAAGDEFGTFVSLSSDGTIVAIGGNLNDGTGTDAGHVRVLQWSGSAWMQLGADIDGEAAEDKFGNSVSLSSDGTIVAIGGTFGTVTDAGHVRVLSGIEPLWRLLVILGSSSYNTYPHVWLLHSCYGHVYVSQWHADRVRGLRSNAL